MANTSLVTEASRQKLIDDVVSLSTAVTNYTEAISALVSDTSYSISQFIAYENGARNEVINTANAQIDGINSLGNTYISSYSSQLNAHINTPFAQVHAIGSGSSTWLDNTGDIIAYRYIAMPTASGIFYVPASTSQTGPA